MGLKTGTHSHRILRLASVFLASFVALLTFGVHLCHTCSLSTPLLAGLTASDLLPGGVGSGEFVKIDANEPCSACMLLALLHAMQIAVFVAAPCLLAGAGIPHLRQEALISNYISSTLRSRAPPVGFLPA